MKWLRSAALVLAFNACSDATSPRLEGDPVGVFALQTINGNAVPVVVDQDSTATLEVTGGSISLNGDGSFTDNLDLRLTEGTIVTAFSDNLQGTWTRSGNTITFQVIGFSAYSLTWNENELTQVFSGFTLVYRR